MTPAERIVAALRGQPTDRVPTLSLFMDPNIINQTLGVKPLPILPWLRSRRGGRFVDRHVRTINRLFNLGILGFNSLCALVNYRLGFDAFWVAYWRYIIRSNKDLWDVFGREFEIVDDGHGNIYMLYSRGMLRTPDEWRAWPRPEVAKYAGDAGRMYRLLKLRWREKIALIPLVAPGLWENSWQPMGFPGFVTLIKRDPGFVREVIGYFTTLNTALTESFCHAGAPAIVLGDDLSYKSGPMLSPEMLDDLYGDGYRQITATAHRLGKPIILHCCGNSEQLLDLFIDWGFDGAHAFEPTAGNDLAAARAEVEDGLCLVGNVDVTHVLTEADKEEVEEAVREAIDKSAGGGFILAPVHTHGDINVDNVRWMIEAAERYGPRRGGP